MSSANGLTIFLPKQLSETGGTSTFARNFQRGMQQRGHTVTFTWQHDYDILVASPTAPLSYLLHAKLHRRPVIHRLDGVYYPGSSAGWLWRPLNLQLSIIRTFFTDAVIYQSEYSRYACDHRLLAANPKVPSTIIYNGVDPEIFSPEGDAVTLKDNPDQHLFVTASRFRTEDQIIPLLKMFSFYRTRYEMNAKLVLIGPFQERVSNVPRLFKQAPGVVFLGTIPHGELAAHLRAADVFVLTHKSPPCPNNVLEAMACGLPICGVADGAMPELVTAGTEGELLPEPDNNTPFPAQSLADLLARIMHNRAAYAYSARDRIIRDFTLTQMLDSYNLLLQNAAQTQKAKN